MATTAVDIPIIDLGPYLAGEREAVRRAAGALRRALEDVGFYYTEHRVRYPASRDRYAVPYFFDPNTHWPIECLPTCHGPDNPPRYEPTTYERYLAWFTDGNYRAETTARP